MAGEYDDLAVISLYQPLKSCFQPLVIIQHKAVVKDKGHGIPAVLDQLGRRQADRQINLVHGAAAYLFDGHKLARGVHEYIHVFIDAHAGIDAPRNT